MSSKEQNVSDLISDQDFVGCNETLSGTFCYREQDFGNFQDAEGKKREKADRLRFGRFYYRFPDGESGADVYDRLTIFEDHVRDAQARNFCVKAAGSQDLVASKISSRSQDRFWEQY